MPPDATIWPVHACGTNTCTPTHTSTETHMCAYTYIRKRVLKKRMIVADAQGALFPAETKFSSLANAVPYDEKIIT